MNDETIAEESTLTDDVKKIVGGVATIALIVIPIVLIHRLIRTLENGSTFKSIERALG
ncbi:MAG: hypothetical protein UHS51_03595 [Atopobiaceae bacterium]|jgi:hypothetical protein|nr:hypothetical protein [Atopobiaceae bacterium]